MAKYGLTINFPSRPKGAIIDVEYFGEIPNGGSGVAELTEEDAKKFDAPHYSLKEISEEQHRQFQQQTETETDTNTETKTTTEEGGGEE